MTHDAVNPKAMGVYFSANDAVYDWAIAFLNSFRTFNPDLRLLLIPFNDACDRLLTQQDTYTFELYTDPAFERLEAIGQAFELGHTPTGPYWFRRYAAFWGPCDRFMYLDARQVVLADLRPVIQALDDYDFDLLHFDCALDQVYEPGEFRRSLLRQGKARGFLSGLWAARKGLFGIESLEHLAESALQVREHLNARNTDQAFINYCCDMQPVRYGHVAEVLGDLCQNAWARQSGQVYREGHHYRLWDYGGLDHRKQVILLHWAGLQLHTLLDRYFLLSSFFPTRGSLPILFLKHAKYLIESAPFIFLYILKRNRLVNTLFHALKKI